MNYDDNEIRFYNTDIEEAAAWEFNYRFKDFVSVVWVMLLVNDMGL